MSRAIDGKSFSNISATTAAFVLDGGTYGVDCVGSGFGTVTVQKLGADGTTWLPAMTAFSANGYASAQLPRRVLSRGRRHGDRGLRQHPPRTWRVIRDAGQTERL